MKSYYFLIAIAAAAAVAFFWFHTQNQTMKPQSVTVAEGQQLLPSPRVATEPKAATSQELKPSESPQLTELEEILKSKNDNDPRLDKDFLNLNDSTKELFRKKYAALPAEKRNEKGTIVFLLGRNLTSPEDFKFLESVLLETPCYSLADCKASSASPGDPEHGEMGGEVTLAYPQLVSLKAIEKLLEKGVHDDAQVARVIEAGKSSSVAIVSRLAEKLAAKLKH